MIAMEIGHDLGDLDRPHRALDPQDLWAEHGWALTGRQTGGILAAIVLASALLAAVGA